MAMVNRWTTGMTGRCDWEACEPIHSWKKKICQGSRQTKQKRPNENTKDRNTKQNKQQTTKQTTTKHRPQEASFFGQRLWHGQKVHRSIFQPLREVLDLFQEEQIAPGDFFFNLQTARWNWGFCKGQTIGRAWFYCKIETNNFCFPFLLFCNKKSFATTQLNWTKNNTQKPR